MHKQYLFYSIYHRPIPRQNLVATNSFKPQFILPTNRPIPRQNLVATNSFKPQFEMYNKYFGTGRNKTVASVTNSYA